MKKGVNTSLPAVDRPNADRWNAARSRQLEKGIFTKKLYTFTKTQTPLQGPASSLDHMGIVYTCRYIVHVKFAVIDSQHASDFVKQRCVQNVISNVFSMKSNIQEHLIQKQTLTQW